MLQRFSPWLAAGLTSGLVILLGFWLIALFFLNTYIWGQQRSAIDQKLAHTVIEATLDNPQVQTTLKNLMLDYLNSPEGKARLTEVVKSPEIASAVAESVQTPEMQTAVLKLMNNPQFKEAVLQTIKDTPEMKKLVILSAAITLDETEQSLAVTSRH
ncbi:MAG: Spore germination GerD central core domain [Firmicutes bacterium]|nr:Spore germination GerD central core domain [Bacillota bacterium]